MTEQVWEPAYWKRRIERTGPLHHSIFVCESDRWKVIEHKHRQILSELIQEGDSVLDIGCGYGRLLTLLPPDVSYYYTGVDLSPDFVQLAREKHPRHRFEVQDVRELSLQDKFTWAVIISFRPMIKRNMGNEVWEQMERKIREHADRLLFLEYDPEDGGSVE